jgi:benzoylformate decarboxylase
VNGARALLEMLRSAGVEYLFGNPGTTELPLLDELVSFEGIAYHLVLQESVAIGMADGYAQAGGRVGVLSLHATGGVANTLGLLYNAGRAGTPLLLLCGQQDTRLALQEPFLHSDMVRWVRPMVKWAHEVAHASDLGRALRRALNEALTPPAGPVFLSLPLDVLRGDATVEDIAPHVARRVAPDPAGLEAATDLLRHARAPVIAAGDRVAQAGAEAELLALAEATGWPVLLEPYPTRFIFPTQHPLARGALPRFAAGVRTALSDHDVVLAAGMTPFEHFLYDGTSPLPDAARVVHVDVAAGFIGRNHPVAAGVPGDLRTSLAALRMALGKAGPSGGGAPVPEGGSGSSSAAAGDPYEPVADAVAAVLRPDDILVEEAISARSAVLGRIPRTAPGTFFGEKGGTIGWGMPASLGVKLAHPDRRVVAVVGDGGLLMAAQGLWTAARYAIAVTLVVLNNHGYTILKQGLAGLGGQAAQQGTYPGTEVPGVDLAALARSFGVAAERVEVAGLSGALSRAFEARAPVLIDVRLEVSVRPLA